MTQDTNPPAGAEGNGWAQQAPLGPIEPPAGHTAPSVNGHATATVNGNAPSAQSAPPQGAPAPQAAPAHAAPRREWPFAPQSAQAPQAPQGWAAPSSQPSAPQPPAPQPPAPQPPQPASGYPTQAYPTYPPQHTPGYPPQGRPAAAYPPPGADETRPYPTATFAAPAPDGVDITPPPVVPAPRRERRSPGWWGVMGASLASALLAGGIVAAVDGGSSSSTPATTVTQHAQAAPVVGSGSSTAPDWPTVAKAVAPSVVAVQVTTAQGGGQGSGVVYDTKGNIVTNNHVVDSATKVVVVLSDGREFDASVVGTDPSTDLAVIRVNNPPSDLTAATFGDSDSVTVGSSVMAIGNPLGLSDTITTGIVSAVNRPVTAQAESENGSEQVVTNAIQTDAAINPGNSGGALLDAQGRVVGIPSSIATMGGGSSLFPGQSSQSGSIGLGFAIPANEAKAVADQIIATNGKTVEHAWLGVQLQEGTVTLDGARRKAALLGEVTAGSPAAKAGLKANDAVIAMNGESIAGADSLVAQVRERRTKDTVTLTIVRNGKKQDVTVTLGVRPANLG